MTQPIQFYFWPTPNGWKISVALEEMALPYEVTLININAGDQHKPEFRAINPHGKMPAITDPDGPDGAPITIFESGAILQYLARKTGLFYGTTERARIEVDQWLHWQVASVGPMAGQVHHFVKYAPFFDPPVINTYAQDRYVNETARLYGMMDKRLAEYEFLAGDFYSIADIAAWGWSSLWEGQRQTLEDKPHFARWLDTMAQRPAVQRGRALHAELRDGTPFDPHTMRDALFGASR